MSIFEKIYLFNTVIGRDFADPNTPEFFSRVSNQAGLVLEETQETLDASIDENLLEVIDGVSDIMVTALGLYQNLGRCGVDISAALDKVCDNNLTKFHKTLEEANKTVAFYQDQGIETFVRLQTLDDGSEYYPVLQKSDEKLMKPYNFTPVDLTEFVVTANA